MSHTSDRSFWDILKLAEGPVVASHSNCRALCDVRRNLTDEQLRAIRDTGGVIGVNVYHGFVHAEPRMQTAAMLARHAAHIAETIGPEHVACGFDFCEYFGPGNEGCEGMENCAQTGNFFFELERLGFQRQSGRALPPKICCGCWNRLENQCENRNFSRFPHFFARMVKCGPVLRKRFELFINMAYNILCIDIERDGSAAP